ncbi:transcriptional regulator [bacteria symbiont BFo1 of Frankliniella occidentalis]|jgi:LacI family transcriptional regulator|uniref:HTH-type transcriptional regulator GalS n=1 Tax=Erwinia aphidicola TaxID=68334 RepID=UPI0006644F65|nr:HTH-type transcriptional regulator GalS [Erwinia aphidicola]KMV71340.1 transcriptional regulator [bacteria symbiont BFo1 of Frankliniella occidentalis]PIJ56039.1 DNA-binding transcriptional regulator GalS [Erwinia sp. OLMDLW33]KYP85283.1 transcriptional regulator [bacteria symbiont BFo1 of Frankliniella occidentalis]KYP90702.1 transcriptional regulator [bacteria symbiont BFo1 of Frankliniella occidentalis]MBD1375596.1 HTH-type transcriptional regulator GalS [Erwinia aphidicola]
MITIRDVAREAGVSVATVSRVLNNSASVTGDTRDTVLKTVERLGYRPNANAQALATQVSDTIGVVVMDVSDPFFGALVKAVDTVAQRLHKHVLINNSYHQADKERHAIEVLIRQRCNALIVHAKALCDAELGSLMQQVPGMVLVNRIIPGFAHRCVCLDNVSGALMAMRMLQQHGHQRIGYLGSAHPIEDNDQRREGWSQALTEQGIVPVDSWCASGEPDLQGGEAAMVELLGRNLHLTAVFAYNDSMAAGALAALKDNGIAVPQQLSVVGFDDIPISRYTDPQLSTVRYPIVSMAKLATELALKGAAGELDSSAEHCFMPTLVRRHSVAVRQNVAAVTNSGESGM